MPPFKDYSGQKFFMLTVLKHKRDFKPNGKPYMKWLCRCECGDVKE